MLGGPAGEGCAVGERDPRSPELHPAPPDRIDGEHVVEKNDPSAGLENARDLAEGLLLHVIRKHAEEKRRCRGVERAIGEWQTSRVGLDDR